MKIPRKESLVQQTVEAMKEIIRNGEIASPLQGERVLASSLQIGRDTLRAALTELTVQGWISEGTQGKRREILISTEEQHHQAKRANRVIMVSPKRLDEIPRALLIELNALRSLLEQHKIALDVVTPSVFETSQPGKKLEQLVQDNPCDVWILYQSTKPVQQWFQENKIPCIVRGYSHEGVDLPFYDEDWEAASYHAASQLLSKGHRSIGLVRPDKQLQGLSATEEGLRKCYDNLGDDHKLHIINEKGEFKQVVQSIQKALSTDNPPTALILTRARHALNVISWLASFGMHVPKHLSIIALFHEPLLEELHPKLCYYACSAEKMGRVMSKKILANVNGTGSQITSAMMIPDFVPGATIAQLNTK